MLLECFAMSCHLNSMFCIASFIFCNVLSMFLAENIKCKQKHCAWKLATVWIIKALFLCRRLTQTRWHRAVSVNVGWRRCSTWKIDWNCSERRRRWKEQPSRMRNAMFCHFLMMMDSIYSDFQSFSPERNIVETMLRRIRAVRKFKLHAIRNFTPNSSRLITALSSRFSMGCYN